VWVFAVHSGPAVVILRYRRGGLRLIATALTGRVGAWTSYLDVAFPGTKPADYTEAIAALRANLREPGRMAVAQQMGKSQPTDAEAKLARNGRLNRAGADEFVSSPHVNLCCGFHGLASRLAD
jgi:hypothetical protein